MSANPDNREPKEQISQFSLLKRKVVRILEGKVASWALAAGLTVGGIAGLNSLYNRSPSWMLDGDTRIEWRGTDANELINKEIFINWYPQLVHDKPDNKGLVSMGKVKKIQTDSAGNTQVLTSRILRKDDGTTHEIEELINIEDIVVIADDPFRK